MRDRGIRIGQYAYTKDGDIIRIDEICEDEKKYKGCVITKSDYPRIILSVSDIYEIAWKFYSSGAVLTAERVNN